MSTADLRAAPVSSVEPVPAGPVQIDAPTWKSLAQPWRDALAIVEAEWQAAYAGRLGDDFRECVEIGRRRSLLFRAVEALDNLAAGFDRWPDDVKQALSPTPRWEAAGRLDLASAETGTED